MSAEELAKLLADPEKAGSAQMELRRLFQELERWRRKGENTEQSYGCNGLCMATESLESTVALYREEFNAAVEQRDKLRKSLEEIASCSCQVQTFSGRGCGQCVICIAQKALDALPVVATARICLYEKGSAV